LKYFDITDIKLWLDSIPIANLYVPLATETPTLARTPTKTIVKYINLKPFILKGLGSFIVR